MERTTSVGHGGDPAVHRDLLILVGLWSAEHRVQVVSASDTVQTQAHSVHPTHQKISRHLPDREPTELIGTTATATSDDRRPTDEKTPNQVHLLATDRVVRHTHMQQVARCIHVDRGSGDV